MNIGFSTGSLAYGDFEAGIQMQLATAANVIELSALRENELENLLEVIDDLHLDQFDYVSFHAPSKLIHLSEKDLIKQLSIVAEKQFNIIVHPDIIQDFSEWKIFGDLLCIENMDKRKPIGQTTYDLLEIFEMLPDASFCFDLAHAKQVDPTMIEAISIAKVFKDKIKELHISDVNSRSVHEPLNLEAILSFRKLKKYLNEKTPIILETPVLENQLDHQIRLAKLIFDDSIFDDFMNEWNLQVDHPTGIVSSRLSGIQRSYDFEHL